MMTGYGGTSKIGTVYHYYICRTAKKKKCDKKTVSKQLIEDSVVAECLKLLTDENIRHIAKKVAEECNRDPDNLTVKRLKSAIREAENAIENLWRGIEAGQGVEMMMERINQRQAELDNLKIQLTVEESKKVYLTEPQIWAFLDYVSETAFDDINRKRALINIFVNSVYLYDDHYTLILNTGKKPISKENIPLEDIRAALNTETTALSKCSPMSASAPPNEIRRTDRLGLSCVFIYSGEIRGIEGERASSSCAVLGRGSLFGSPSASCGDSSSPHNAGRYGGPVMCESRGQNCAGGTILTRA